MFLNGLRMILKIKISLQAVNIFRTIVMIICLRSSPPMYFIVISQCPQTADTIGCNFLPLSPLNATPRYWPSTTNANVPSSISRTTVERNCACHESKIRTRVKKVCFLRYISHDNSITFCAKLRNCDYAEIAYPEICQEQWMSRRTWGGLDTLRQCCFSSHDRVCFYQDPNPNWARCYLPNSDSRHYVEAHPPSRLLPLRAYLVASCSNKAPIRAYL